MKPLPSTMVVSFEHKRFNNYFSRTLAPVPLPSNVARVPSGSLDQSVRLHWKHSEFTSCSYSPSSFFRFYDNATQSELVQIVSKTSFMTMYLIFRFSQLNDVTDKLTVIAANTHRVQAFIEYMEGIDTTWDEKQSYRPMPNSEVLQIKDLSYSTPNGGKYVLMKNLSLTLNVGQRLLITGSILSS